MKKKENNILECKIKTLKSRNNNIINKYKNIIIVEPDFGGVPKRQVADNQIFSFLI